MTANRSELLSDDQSVVLRRLLSYNSAVEVSQVITQAEALRRRGHTPPPPALHAGSPPDPSRVHPSTSTAEPSPPSQQPPSASSSSGGGSKASGGGKGPVEVPYWLKGGGSPSEREPLGLHP